MPFGDGRLIREYVEGFFRVLTRYLRGTEGEGSTWLIWGGLVIIGFILMGILFRTLVLGDLAPLANRPVRRPRALTRLRALPAEKLHEPAARTPEEAYKLGRIAGRRGPGKTLDEILDTVYESGLGEPRVLGSGEVHKRIRIHNALDGPAPDHRAEYVRGYLEGAFERLLGTPVEATRAPADAKGAFEVHLEYSAAWRGGRAK